MNRNDLDRLTVRELGDIAAERGVSATSLLMRDNRPHIVWPDSIRPGS